MPIFAAHAVSAELSNGSTHEFTSAGKPSAEICASNAKRSRHVQVGAAPAFFSNSARSFSVVSVGRDATAESFANAFVAETE